MKTQTRRGRLSIYQKFTYGVVTTTERFFYNLGRKVGENPIRTIAICWGLVLASALGVFRFNQEKNPLKLWVPPQSQFAKDTEWLMKNLELGYRKEMAILTAPNVLAPEIILQLLDIHEQVKNATTPNGIKWNDVCLKLPKIDRGLSRMLSRETENGTVDLSSAMDITMLCSFLESIPMDCYHRSLLELWNYNRRVISNLTSEAILNRVNNHDELLILGHLKNYTGLLGGITRNSTGQIISAGSVLNVWMTKLNFSAVDMDKAGNVAGTADWASEESLEWELKFERILSEIRANLPEKLGLVYMSARTFGDVTGATMFQDIDKLLIGGVIMVVYVIFVISKFNMLEARVLLACSGMLSVGMSFVVGCGICFSLGIPFGPVHTSLPFLLMGLGVDDMFVIMACHDDLTPAQKKLPTPEVLGLMLKHAGVSITITSVTDILAFLIGSSTIIPNLQSYCFYAAVSVAMTFVFAVTFFCACFALDQNRIENERNGCLPWIRHENHTPNSCSQRQMSNRNFELIFDKIILTPPVKVLIICGTLALGVFSTLNCMKLEQKFDPHWFVPETEQLHDYFETRLEFYPSFGFDAGIYMGALNYTAEVPKIARILDELQLNSNIVQDIVDWLNPFRDFVKKSYKIDMFNETLDETRFNMFLSKFLINPQYAKYQSNFQFENALECGAAAPRIKMAYIGFNFPIFHGPSEYLPAMHRVREIAENANFTSGDKFCTAWSYTFSTWVTDEIIDIEVLRNLQLALLSVMICTILLVADIQTCCWIFVSVLLSMVNVCGFMQLWGLTIDIVSCIGLELAIGLCVDYATHIGHTFLTVEGTRRERALKTVTSIGSAVLYGGLSTLIGVCMLALSDAYTFQAFFKIFFLVITFGLFHGVIVMPVIFSTIGPNPYVNLHIEKDKPELEVSMKNNEEFMEMVPQKTSIET